jgi:hypothetical protein
MAFQETGSAAKLVDAINALLSTLIRNYGPLGTLGLIIGAVALFLGIRLFTDWIKNQKTDKALEEKERSIKRLAKEVRMYRAVFLKEKAGWDDNLISQFLLGDDVESPKPRRWFKLPWKKDTEKDND